MSLLMFTQLLLCGFVYVLVDGKLKTLLSFLGPPPGFLFESDVGYT